MGPKLLFRKLLGVLRPGGIFRVCPAMLLVEHVAQAIHRLLVTWRGDVEAFARRELHARRAEVQLDAAFMAVPNPEHVDLVAVQTGEGQLVEGIHDGLLLLFRRMVVLIEADHARPVSPGVGAGIDQGPGVVRIARQDFRKRIAGLHQRDAVVVADKVAIGVVGEHVRGDQIIDRCSAAALATAEQLNQHGPHPAGDGWQGGLTFGARCRSSRQAAVGHRADACRQPPGRSSRHGRSGSGWCRCG